MSFSPGLSTDRLHHKTAFLRGLQEDQKVALHAAYGSGKDATVYADLGIPPENTFIVGKAAKRQESGVNLVSGGYGEHLATLRTRTQDRPSQGNARIPIPGSWNVR